MALNPDVQRRVQAELDGVIDRSRLPDFANKASLPYVHAIIREVLRWHPVAPLSLPHRVIEDDEYNGYFIPRGSTVLVNLWSLLHNEKFYTEPLAFSPDRFLDESGHLSTPVIDPAKVGFGFGRRVCAGENFAMNSLYIAVASILARFDIGVAKDARGNNVPILLKMSPGLVSIPEDFECSIKPRSI